jgi:AcrR family transcriptional regulator
VLQSLLRWHYEKRDPEDQVHTESPHRLLKEKQRQERAALILQTAEEIFLQKGYSALSMDDIAAQVGIAKGTLYLHFATKDDLVFHLLERDLQHILHMIENSMQSEGSARSKLTRILDFLYQEWLGKHSQFLYLLYNSTELKNAMREKLRGTLQGVVDRITALLDQGKARGEFDPLIPTDVMVSIFFSMLSPQAYQHLVREKQMASADLARYIDRIYFCGIGTQPPAAGE